MPQSNTKIPKIKLKSKKKSKNMHFWPKNGYKMAKIHLPQNLK